MGEDAWQYREEAEPIDFKGPQKEGDARKVEDVWQYERRQRVYQTRGHRGEDA